MKKTENFIMINGPVGKLETIYVPAQSEERGFAIINHPNPLQGGTNTNKVVQTAAKALSQLGFHCYLPNLRGVGNSDGQHDYGQGEASDCLAVIEYAKTQHPQATQFVLSGFSFGGYVSLFTAKQSQPDLLLLIAPAVHFYDIAESYAFDASKTLIIHGEADQIIPLKNALDWANKQDLAVVVLPEASHFFHGKLIQLKDTILRFTPELLEPQK